MRGKTQTQPAIPFPSEIFRLHLRTEKRQLGQPNAQPAFGERITLSDRAHGRAVPESDIIKQDLRTKSTSLSSLKQFIHVQSPGWSRSRHLKRPSCRDASKSSFKENSACGVHRLQCAATTAICDTVTPDFTAPKEIGPLCQLRPWRLVSGISPGQAQPFTPSDPLEAIALVPVIIIVTASGTGV